VSGQLSSWLLGMVLLLPFQPFHDHSRTVKVQKLEVFFGTLPMQEYSYDFVDAADQYHLDWRLLPAISMVESTGGKHCRRGSNNPFGWGSGHIKFNSYPEAIYSVARHLSEDRPYKGKSLHQKLRAYNPAHRTYPIKVTSMMRRVSVEHLSKAAKGPPGKMHRKFKKRYHHKSRSKLPAAHHGRRHSGIMPRLQETCSGQRKR
jgi:hypothetical protein